MARRRRKLRSPAVALVRRHPILASALVVGGGSGYVLDRMVDVTNWTQLVVSAVVAVFVLIGRHVVGIGYGAIYVIDSWDPYAGYTRATCGYVGKTRQHPERRIEQHLAGSEFYGSAPQPWADTVTRWWVAYESRWVTDMGLHLRELVNIRWRQPLYNHTMNLRNRRRIPKGLAVEQRAERDMYV